MDWLTNLEHALNQNLHSFSWTTAIFIFLAYFFLDMMYVRYTLAVVSKKPVVAANVGSLMYILMAFGIFNYTQNFIYILPVGLGSWLGTYIVVAREKFKSM